MAIKVISGMVSHKGTIVEIGGVIDGLDRENELRLCKCGLCEMLGAGDAPDMDGEEKDLDEMTKPELIAYAESIGVDVDSRDTKAKLIEKITNADAPATGVPQE